MCRRRTNLLSVCTVDGKLTQYQSQEEIAKEIRRKEFFKFGGTAELYLFSMNIKQSIKQFRKEH